MIQKLRSLESATSAPQGGRTPGADFRGALTEALRLSNHAQQRFQSRGMSVSPQQAQRLAAGVEAVREKGARSAVVLVDGVAFVVSVPASTVVTAMPADRLRVFTNIDSAVIA